VVHVLRALQPPEEVELARTDAGAWTGEDLVRALG
jgi:hypothetical protein